jgi:EmrB/QacA subfamily drug resistance transporter
MSGEVATASPGDSPELQLSRRRLWLIIGALLIGLLLAALDQTIVATALPTIAGDLHGLSHLSFVVTAYLLASTVSTPIWGKLGDLYGRKIFFQAAIVIFLVGSILAGLAQSLDVLIGFRAIQGLGAGGLIVGAQASIGDVVSPRERGRYQGLFGAVFGVSSVLGPLLGGFFVDNLSYHWIFYINVPIGIVALVVTAVALPAAGQRVHHVIDYAGAALLALGATALVLLTSLGGTSFAWGSAPIVILGVAGLVLLMGFARVERGAAEAIIPPRMFGNRTFVVTGALGFAVGFAMFGAITYLPLYQQVVKGVSPTLSGVHLLPLVGGLLLTSIGSGQAISRWGRYKAFPIVGTALMALGLFLLSQLTPTTGTLQASLAMLVLGLGIGSVIQVLVIAIQNAVDYRDLGTATSGVTFFRSIGGSFGVAVFGAIFANVLVGNLTHFLGHVSLPAGLSGTGGVSPAQLAQLPSAVRTGFIDAYAASLHPVFLVAVPVAGVAFVLAWLLPELPLRTTTRAPDPADTLAPTAIPHTRGSGDELARALSVLTARENRAQNYRTLAERADVDLEPPAVWLLFRMGRHEGMSLADLADHLRVPGPAVGRIARSLAGSGLIRLDGAQPGSGTSRPPVSGDTATTEQERDRYVLTPAGDAALARLMTARHEGLERLLAGWSPEQHAEIGRMVARLAADLLSDEAPYRVLDEHRREPAGERPGRT